MNLKKLSEPFPAKDIEWRVSHGGVKNGRPWAMVLAYVTNRAIMDRLDEVVGPLDWHNEFKPGPEGGVLCGITIQGVTKWDGAENTNVEAIKGGLSSAMKRAAVQWGIGRYLYNLEDNWAIFNNEGKYSAKIEGKWYKWDPPSLPAWALPDRKNSDYEERKEAVIRNNYDRPDPEGYDQPNNVSDRQESTSQSIFAEIIKIVNSDAVPINKKAEILRNARPIKEDDQQLALLLKNIKYEFDIKE